MPGTPASRLQSVPAEPAAVRGNVNRVAAMLSGAGVVTILVANASMMSKAEVERIWLPFIPWMLLSCAFLPERWRRCGLVVQLAVALLTMHLIRTTW